MVIGCTVQAGLLLIVPSTMAAALPPRATLPCGPLIGANSRNAIVFSSIPYGNIASRWTPPQRAACWNGTLDATAHTTMCWQDHGRVIGPASGVQSEQCLNLDVYLTAEYLDGSAPLRPVVVWLYGGSLVHGSAASYPGLGQLAALEEVLLVVPEYRLGAFGFLAHPALDATDPRGVSGNYGVLDQQLALAWVRDNIRHLGGDPSRVSVLGQSSGGTSILALLSSPASRGLFTAAISLSASPNVSMSLQAAHAQFDAVVRERTPCAQPASHTRNGGRGMGLAYQAACLRNLSSAQVAAMLPAAFDVEPSLPISPSGQGYAGLPIVDGVTVTHSPEDALREGLVDVPLLLQTALAEMDTYVNDASVDRMTATQYQAYLGRLLAQRNFTSGVASAVCQTYHDEMSESVELAHQVFIADYSFLCGSIALARAAAAGFRSPVYLSVGMHAPCHPLPVLPGRPPARFSGHNWDLIAAIRSWDFYAIHFGVQPYTPCAADVEWGDMMRRQWVNLTRDGRLAVSDFEPVDAAGSGGHFRVGLQRSVGTQMVTDYARARCATLSSIGLDKRFWLTN